MDCVDRKRIDLARQELHRIISNREMKDAVILVFANKQDLRDGKILISACFLILNSMPVRQSISHLLATLQHIMMQVYSASIVSWLKI